MADNLEEMTKIANELKTLVDRIGYRKFFLKKIQHGSVKGPPKDEMIEMQTGMIRQAELELKIFEKKMEMQYYRWLFDQLDYSREDSFCPSCSHAYEDAKGRKLTEEESMSEEHLKHMCAIHPEHVRGYCPDFKDTGGTQWSIYFRQVYGEIELLRKFIEENEKDLQDMRAKLKISKGEL